MNKKYEVSSLILRLVLGISFFIHGLSKFQGGIANIAGWFDSIGLPGFMAYVVAIIEVAGGIAMVVGLGTRLVAILFTLVMLGAIFTVKLSVGFMGNGQMAGYELDLAFLAMAVFIAINGAKAYALDSFIFKGKKTENTISVN